MLKLRGHNAILSPVATVITFIRRMCWAEMLRYNVPLKNARPVGSGPHLTHCFSDPHGSAPKYGISIGLAIFAQRTRVPNTHYTDHATCDICRNEPHLSYAYVANNEQQQQQLTCSVPASRMKVAPHPQDC